MNRLLLFLVAALLSGCSLLPAAPSTPAMRPAHAESAAFVLNGRISVRHQGNHHSAGLRWVHGNRSDEVLLLAPLGQTAARIYRDDANAMLDDGDKHYSARNAEALMEQVLGWHLPLNGLHHWALGMAVPGSPAQIGRDPSGQIAVLHQDGWEVRYLRYGSAGPDSLPARLQLSRGDLQMQLLIDEWELPSGN